VENKIEEIPASEEEDPALIHDDEQVVMISQKSQSGDPKSERSIKIELDGCSQENINFVEESPIQNTKYIKSGSIEEKPPSDQKR